MIHSTLDFVITFAWVPPQNVSGQNKFDKSYAEPITAPKMAPRNTAAKDRAIRDIFPLILTYVRVKLRKKSEDSASQMLVNRANFPH